MINILFFARLREDMEIENISMEWNSELQSVASVRKHLVGVYPNKKDVLDAPDILVAVNQELVKSTATVTDGDEVAFFPPVTGG